MADLRVLPVQVGLAGRETAIGDAIALAIKRLRGTDQRAPGSQVLVLLTDGVNTAGQVDPMKAAELARDQGVRIHTIAFGGDDPRTMFGIRLPVGEVEIDEEALRRIAQAIDVRSKEISRAVGLTIPQLIVLQAIRSLVDATPQHAYRVLEPLFNQDLAKRSEEEVRELAQLFVKHGGPQALTKLEELLHRRGLTTTEPERELAVTIARSLMRTPDPKVVALLDAVAKDWLVPQRIRSTCKEIADMLRVGS